MTKYNVHENDDYLLQHNKLQIKRINELLKAEAIAFSLRAMKIEQGNYHRSQFDFESLKQLHYFLFQDVYLCAGIARDVQLMKGATRFCQFEYIDRYANELFKELETEECWHTINEAAKRLAYFKSELNMLHPFREGNGRTLRIFLSLYAQEKEYHWAYEEMKQEEYIEAMVQSVTDGSKLACLLEKTLYKIK